jgi:hypothetical protein
LLLRYLKFSFDFYILGMLEQSLVSGLSSEQDYRLVWEAYLDYLRRRVPWDEPGEDREKKIKELRDCSGRAIEHLLESKLQLLLNYMD